MVDNIDIDVGNFILDNTSLLKIIIKIVLQYVVEVKVKINSHMEYFICHNCLVIQISITM